jgi:hypothetical protein
VGELAISRELKSESVKDEISVGQSCQGKRVQVVGPEVLTQRRYPSCEVKRKGWRGVKTEGKRKRKTVQRKD